MKKIKGHTSQHEEHSESNPLADMKRMDVFKTPEGYFKKLPSEIAEKIISNPSHESETGFSYPRLAIAAALIIAVLATGTMYFLNNSSGEKTQVAFTYDDLIDSGFADEYDDEILMDHYFSYSNTVSADSAGNPLNEYLLDGDIDITLIINEL